LVPWLTRREIQGWECRSVGGGRKIWFNAEESPQSRDKAHSANFSVGNIAASWWDKENWQTWKKGSFWGGKKHALFSHEYEGAVFLWREGGKVKIVRGKGKRRRPSLIAHTRN